MEAFIFIVFFDFNHAMHEELIFTTEQKEIFTFFALNLRALRVLRGKNAFALNFLIFVNFVVKCFFILKPSCP